MTVKINILLTTLSLGLIATAISQKQTLDLTFTAVDNAAYIQLDSIKVMNRTHGGETMIYWPDTTLSLEITQGDLLLYVGYATFFPVGISEESNENSSFELYQNHPNPMGDRGEISMDLPQAGKVGMMITDLQGRVILLYERQLEGGHHSFIFYPGGENIYILAATWNGISRSIQMISAGQPKSRGCRLVYIGGYTGDPHLKGALRRAGFMKESGILDTPETNETYIFEFATNIPCPGTPTVEYEGQVYNSIQIFSQCWLKENLNVGTMIPVTQGMSNNSVIEKYCYSNEEDSCTKYGGLYQRDEMMQYALQQGVQGICPPGWHLPTDEEWKVLEGAVDSQYGIGDPEWDIEEDYRGFDAGMNLKSISGWDYEGNGTDLFDFSGLPGGYRTTNSSFTDLGAFGYWWTSSVCYSSFAWGSYLFFYFTEVYRDDYYKEYGLSVRCLKDN